MRLPPCSPLFPYTTLFRSHRTRPLAGARANSRRPPDRKNSRPPARRKPLSRSPSRGSKGAAKAHSTAPPSPRTRSEEHTSELQSLRHLVCRLLLEKKKKKQ